MRVLGDARFDAVDRASTASGASIHRMEQIVVNEGSLSASTGPPEPVLERATIYIVDDNPRTRQLVSRLVTEVGFDAVEYSNGQDFLDQARFDAPCCVVLDIRMPGISGLAVQSRLLELPHSPPVIIVSGQADVPTAVEAMQRGAFHLLEKPFRAQQLIDLVQQAVRENATERPEREKRAAVRRAIDALSLREREVSALALDGLDTREIAARIGISIQAVNGHKRGAMTKLGVDNVPDFVRMLDSIDFKFR